MLQDRTGIIGTTFSSMQRSSLSSPSTSTWALTTYFFWDYESVPFFGGSSIVADLLGTGVILPIVVALIVMARVRKHRRAGELPIPGATQTAGLAARMLPSPLWLRAVPLAIHGVLAAALVLIALRMLSVNAMPFWPFVIFQGMPARWRSTSPRSADTGLSLKLCRSSAASHQDVP